MFCLTERVGEGEKQKDRERISSRLHTECGPPVCPVLGIGLSPALTIMSHMEPALSGVHSATRILVGKRCYQEKLRGEREEVEG